MSGKDAKEKRDLFLNTWLLTNTPANMLGYMQLYTSFLGLLLFSSLHLTLCYFIFILFFHSRNRISGSWTNVFSVGLF